MSGLQFRNFLGMKLGRVTEEGSNKGGKNHCVVM